MNKLAAAFAALRYGSSLTDPAIWKNRQLLINALIGLLGALVLFVPKSYGVEVTEDDIQKIAGGVGTLVGLFNLYFTAATSTKIGLPSGNPPADRPREEADSNADYRGD